MEQTMNRSEIQLIELNMLMELDRICKANNLEYCLAYGSVLGAVRHKGFIPWDEDIDIIVDIDGYKEFCNTIHNEISDNYVLNYIGYDPNYDSLKARIIPKGKFHHLIHIDIFPIVGVPRSKSGRKLFSMICHVFYRAYFVKKVDISINYKENRRKKITVSLLRFFLMPVRAGLIEAIFHKLSILYPIKNSDTIYNICGCYGYKEMIPKQYLGRTVLSEFEGITVPIPEKWDAYLTHLYGDYMTPKQMDHS